MLIKIILDIKNHYRLKKLSHNIIDIRKRKIIIILAGNIEDEEDDGLDVEEDMKDREWVEEDMKKKKKNKMKKR